MRKLGLAVALVAGLNAFARADGAYDQLKSADGGRFGEIADNTSSGSGAPPPASSSSALRPRYSGSGLPTAAIADGEDKYDKAHASASGRSGSGIKTGGVGDFLVGALAGAGAAWLLGALGIGLFGGPMGLLLGVGLGMLLTGLILPSLRGKSE